jgi:hypothetical protein
MVKSGYLVSTLLVVVILPVSHVFAQGCPFCPDGEHECTAVDDWCIDGRESIDIPDSPPPPCANDRTFVGMAGTPCRCGAGRRQSRSIDIRPLFWLISQRQDSLPLGVRPVAASLRATMEK